MGDTIRLKYIDGKDAFADLNIQQTGGGARSPFGDDVLAIMTSPQAFTVEHFDFI